MPDREKVIKALDCFSKNRICLPHLIPWDEIVDALAMLKEQDAVVQCKDCRFFTEPDSNGDQCAKIHWSRGADWFCADGERKG